MTVASPAARVARNASMRAAGEIVGKLASLALMVVLARDVGPHGLGVFVFGLAWAELSTVFVGPGLGRILSRWIAREPGRVVELVPDVVGTQLRRAAPVAAASWLVLWIVGSSPDARTVVVLFTVVFLLDAITQTYFSAFDGIERSYAIGLVLAAQRILTALLGLGAIVLLDRGVVAVVGCYVVGSAVALVLAARTLRGFAGPMATGVGRSASLEMRRRARPLAAQELLSVGIARFDAVLVSLLAGATAVGFYGAAYRLLEATLFVSTALASAFVAMFTYLDEDSEPTLAAVVGRALKLSLALLTPLAVMLAFAPGRILALFYGQEFTAAADTLRILAPAVVLLGNVILTSALAASRGDPRHLVRAFAAGLAANVVANVLLVPPLEERGAALAMLATELVLCVLLMRITLAEVGRLDTRATVGATAVAAAAMAASIVLTGAAPLAVVLTVAAIVYVAVFALVERTVAPADFAFMRNAVASRAPVRRRRGPEDPSPRDGR